jgi:hypothetical protein
MSASRSALAALDFAVSSARPSARVGMAALFVGSLGALGGMACEWFADDNFAGEHPGEGAAILGRASGAAGRLRHKRLRGRSRRGW